MSKSRVFIIQEPKAHMDLSGCDKYGELSMLFIDNERRPSVFDTENYGKVVLDKLKSHNFDPTIDYICITGAMVGLCTALIAITSAYDEFMVLLFSSNSSQYVARKVGFLIWGPEEETQSCKHCDGTECDRHSANGKPVCPSCGNENCHGCEDDS